MAQTIEGTRPVGQRTAVGVSPTQASHRARVFTALGAFSVAVTGVAFLAYGVRAGMPASNAMRALLVVAVTQVLPGALIWRAVRPRHGWWLEDLAMGFAIGAALAVGVQVVAGLSQEMWLAAGSGPCVAAVLLLIPHTRSRILAARSTPLLWWWGPLVAAASLVALPILQVGFSRQPLSWSAGSRVPYIDSYFHLALSGELATRGPTTFPWVESEPLAYHWFSHAWVAQVSNVSGAGLDEVLFVFMPVFMPLVVVVIVATAAVRLSGRAWTGPVAAILTMAGGDLNVFGKLTPGYPVSVLSPSLTFGAPPLIATVTVLALRWRGQLRRGSLGILLVVCIGAAGAKGSTIPLVIAGLGVAAVAMLIVDRTRFRQVLIDSIIVVGCFLFVVACVLRGAGETLRIDPSATADQSALARWLGGVSSFGATTFVLTVTVCALVGRALGSLGLLASRDSRRDPLTWLLVGASVAGASAVAFVYHTSASQYYFARSAAPLMALGSALGLVVIMEKLGAAARIAIPAGIVAGPLVALVPLAILGPLEPGGTWHAVAMIALATGVLVIVAVVAALISSSPALVLGATMIVGLLAAGTTVVVRTLVQFDAARALPAVAATEPGAVSRDQIDAARWIRDNSDLDDLVITNRHCVGARPPVDCSSRRFVVAAFSERQVLVEGWSYTPRIAEIAGGDRAAYFTVNYWEPELLALNDGFIADPTAQTARQLQELGVRWIFVDHTIPHARTLEPYAELRFSNSGVDVYELPSVG